MATKPGETPFDRAARKLRVPRFVVKLWLVDARGATPTHWSQWKSGERPISSQFIDGFLEWLTGEGDAGWEESESLKEYLAWLAERRAPGTTGGARKVQ